MSDWLETQARPFGTHFWRRKIPAGTDTSDLPEPVDDKLCECSGHSTFIWPLSKGMNAQVTFSGGTVRAAHLEMLAKYLEIAKGALEAEEEEQ